jgi:hypothetical protein
VLLVLSAGLALALLAAVRGNSSQNRTPEH